MTVICVPVRLRVAAATLLTSIPLVAAEVLLVSRAPWWNLPVRQMCYWSLGFALICLPLMSWLLEGKKFAYYLSGALAMVWVSTSVFLAVKMNFPSLGFFTVLIGMILLAQFGWLYIEFHRSFFDPGLAWYQALPGAIPNLVCRLEKGDIQVNLRVSRIDRDGAFVFGKLTEEALFQPFFTLAQSNQLEAYFLFRNLSLRCAAIPVVLIQRGIGVGIQFVKTTSDSSKEIVDFVEVLRGEGYV